MNCISKITCLDQTGYISKRKINDNIRFVITALEYINNKKKEVTVISLDAEKAFDNLDWISTTCP